MEHYINTSSAKSFSMHARFLSLHTFLMNELLFLIWLVKYDFCFGYLRASALNLFESACTLFNNLLTDVVLIVYLSKTSS